MGARIIPLIILIVVVSVIAVIGYIAWSIAQEVTRTTRSKMEKKNVVWTRDGMKVGVKELKDEEYKDRSQRFVSSPLHLLLPGGFSGWNANTEV